MPEAQPFEMPFGLNGGPATPLRRGALASSKLDSRVLLAGAALLAVCVFAFDAFTEFHVAIAVLYVVVVQLVAASGSLKATNVAAGGCGLLTLLALALAHEPDYAGGALARCAISLFALSISTALAIRHLRNTGAIKEYVQLLNLTHDAIVVYDLSGTVKFWNRGAETLYGWSNEDALEKDIHHLTNTQFPSSREALYESLYREGHWEGELTRTHRDGSILAVESRIALWRDNRGRPVAIMATNNDVTSRRDSERELERNHAYAEEAERLSKTGSLMRYGSDAKQMYWSRECYRILGIPFETEPSLDTVIARTHPDDIELVRALDQSIRNGEPLIDGTHRLLLPTGEVKHVRFVARRSTKSSEHGQKYVGALMDITAVVAAEEALQRSMSELAHVMRLSTLGGLATTIAHEVTQPLAAIVTWGDTALSWLDRAEPDIQEAKVSIEQIIIAAERSTEIVKQIRAMAQKREPQRVAVPMNALVSDAARLVARECRTAMVDLELDLHPRDASVKGDPVQLQQVLVNLLMNAIQAMADIRDRRRVLKVCTTLDGLAAAKIEVIDSGPGFREEDAHKLFGAFYTTKETGLGMGLSICRSIVEAHGGKIWATRGDPGAVFHLELRLANESAP